MMFRGIGMGVTAMQRIILRTAVAVVAATTGSGLAAESVKVGIIMGFTGPIESLTP